MTTACKTCPHLVQMGIKDTGWDYVIALAGNPNTGKSTVFNALTGLRQHTGNWPGKTVTRMEGTFGYGAHAYKIVDLPGTYSLLAASEDEEVARSFILFGRPDVTVVVVDATRLERNLNLVYQVMEITDRVVVALNLMDEAERHGLRIDHRGLAGHLGVSVVPMVARQGTGIDALLAAIAGVASGKQRSKPKRFQLQDPGFERAVKALTAEVQAAFPGLPNARWIAIRLLDGDPDVTAAVQNGSLRRAFA